MDSSSARSTCRRYLVITTCLAPLAYACVCVRVCAVQVGLLLPLSVTGFVWALGCVLYVGSGNLLVPNILIHALCGTRACSSYVPRLLLRAVGVATCPRCEGV